MSEIKQGDKVTHWRAPDRVGTVVSIQNDRYSWEKIYIVAYTEDGPGISYRSGLTKADVIERSWYESGMGTPRPMTREQFGRDMVDIREWGETVHVWSGQDRDGNPLKVVWLTRPRMGRATLYAYEISGSE